MSRYDSLRARLRGRSYWRLYYADGSSVSEHDCDWSRAPYEGRVSVRLFCPDGQVAVIGNTEDATGRLFQLKVGEMRFSEGRRTLAHVVGIVDDVSGDCTYAAWDYDQKKLVTGRDNVHAMQYHQIGALATQPLGLAS